jgi:hypothetical protein
LIAVPGTPTRQSNQMFLSAAPTRIVPRLDPVGRIEIDGICSGSGRTRGCCANETTDPNAIRATTTCSVFFITLILDR